MNALENQGLVELAGLEDRAELSALEGRPVRWAARLTSYGHDTLAYAQSRPRPESTSGEADPDAQAGFPIYFIDDKTAVRVRDDKLDVFPEGWWRFHP
ncbi:hypothetical protein [Streptomyces mirabilis]|uniref:hypothetical protein n=1 Tax=Streptomyces mirabilis TaxID=68239 RepID=UPI0036DD2DF2